MKKQLILCGLAAAACIAYASGEKINLVKNGSVFNSIRVEKIDHIGYSGDTDGYNTIDIYTLDGKKTSVSLDGIDHIEYMAPLPANPIALSVEPHHYCATITVNTQDENAWYRIAGVHQSSLAGHDEADWADIVVGADIDYIYGVAAEYGRPLSSFPMDQIFERGSQTRDWYPSETTYPETDIVIVAYTARLNGDEVEVTTEPVRVDFTTKKIEDLGVKFDVSAEMTSNTITVKADAQGGSDIPFAIQLYSAEEIAVNGLQSLVQNSLIQMQQLVFNYGYEWDELTYRIHGEKTWTNRRMGDQWFAVVFGCEYGIATTDASWEVFTIPAAEITDPCTFDATATQLSPSEMEVKVVPSSPDTRYAAFLVEADKINEDKTVEQYVADQIYWINSMNTFQWDNTDFIHTGEATLNTHDDLIGGEYLKADKEYYAVICGIDETGTRTTEVKTVSCLTTSQVAEGLRFDVSFSDFDASGSYYHFITVNVTPTDPEAKYVIVTLDPSNMYADLNCTDEEFINRYADVQGQYLELTTGPVNKRMSFGRDFITNEFKPQMVFIFGYDGAPTSPLYAFEVNTETGEVEMVRGPKDEELTFTVTPGTFNDSSSFTHFLEVTVTPSDPSAKYVFEKLSADNAYADLSYSDEEFVSRYVDVQGQYLELETGEKTKNLAFSSDYVTGNFEPYILMVFGYDGAQTSPLYLYSVDTATGTLTQLRGPGM